MLHSKEYNFADRSEETGVITPVAELEPIKIKKEQTISRVSLHNLMMK